MAYIFGLNSCGYPPPRVWRCYGYDGVTGMAVLRVWWYCGLCSFRNLCAVIARHEAIYAPLSSSPNAFVVAQIFYL